MKLQSLKGFEYLFLSLLIWLLTGRFSALSQRPLHKVGHNMASARASDSRDRKSKMKVTLSKLGSDIPAFLPYSIGHADQLWYDVKENYMSVNTRSWKYLGIILDAGYHTS